MTRVGPEPENLLIKRKRLRYRSWNRGMKETDLLLGRFADRHLDSFDERQLGYYDDFLEENDPDILAWIIGDQELPPKHRNDVTDLLRNFKFHE